MFSRILEIIVLWYLLKLWRLDGIMPAIARSHSLEMANTTIEMQRHFTISAPSIISLRTLCMEFPMQLTLLEWDVVHPITMTIRTKMPETCTQDRNNIINIRR